MLTFNFDSRFAILVISLLIMPLSAFATMEKHFVGFENSVDREVLSREGLSTHQSGTLHQPHTGKGLSIGAARSEFREEREDQPRKVLIAGRQFLEEVYRHPSFVQKPYVFFHVQFNHTYSRQREVISVPVLLRYQVSLPPALPVDGNGSIEIDFEPGNISHVFFEAQHCVREQSLDLDAFLIRDRSPIFNYFSQFKSAPDPIVPHHPYDVEIRANLDYFDAPVRGGGIFTLLSTPKPQVKGDVFSRNNTEVDLKTFADNLARLDDTRKVSIELEIDPLDPTCLFCFPDNWRTYIRPRLRKGLATLKVGFFGTAGMSDGMDRERIYFQARVKMRIIENLPPSKIVDFAVQPILPIEN